MARWKRGRRFPVNSAAAEPELKRVQRCLYLHLCSRLTSEDINNPFLEPPNIYSRAQLYSMRLGPLELPT